MRLRILVREVLVAGQKVTTWIDEDLELKVDATVASLLKQLEERLAPIVNQGAHPFVTLEGEEPDPTSRIKDLYRSGDTVEVWL
ncbi:MAG: hypothetical protein QF415_01295 [Candidatus Undinarchaeales archaeon]|jgi:hypothetical protein|nr:hypothetical protein [Candidatus Undinarchaeales archaeon]MDP7493287.1 hypothetical protein [Candidatus Undinarchaeales archaeon]